MQLGPLVSQMMPVVEASPISSMARSASGKLHLRCRHKHLKDDGTWQEKFKFQLPFPPCHVEMIHVWHLF